MLAAWRRAASLAGCQTSTRGSFRPAVQQHRRIGHAVPDQQVGVHDQQAGQPLLGGHAAELGHVDAAVLPELGPKGVGEQDLEHHRRPQLGPACQRAPAAVPPALTPLPASRSGRVYPWAIRCSAQSIMSVMVVSLAGPRPAWVPLPAVLAAAPDVGHRVDAAPLVPGPHLRDELGRRSEPVGAVGL